MLSGVVQPGSQGWGFDEAFLVGYVLLCVVVVGAVLAWYPIRVARSGGDIDANDLDPYQVAYLNDGSRLVLLAAVCALHVEGAVVLRRHRVAARPAAEASGAGRARIEHAVLSETRDDPCGGSDLAASRAVEHAMTGLGASLESWGLLLDETQRAAMRWWGLWLWAAIAVGVARLVVAGHADELVVLLPTMGVVLLVARYWQTRLLPRRSATGEATLRRWRREHEQLAPAQRPDWASVDPADAALGVGLFGFGAVSASDPIFADEVLPVSTGGDPGFWGGLGEDRSRPAAGYTSGGFYTGLPGGGGAC